MSAYLSKSSSVDRDYVVIRHTIPHMNATIMGVRFRDSWAVVEKNSKIYYKLQKLPMMKTFIEKPLDFLLKLPFINRSADIKLVYGADVYAKFMTFYNKKEEQDLIEEAEAAELAHINDPTKCNHRKKDGELCRLEVQDIRVSDHCSLHILKDPDLLKTGFKVPMAMDSKLRKKLRKTAFNKLKEYRKSQEKANVSVDQEEARTEETEQDNAVERELEKSSNGAAREDSPSTN